MTSFACEGRMISYLSSNTFSSIRSSKSKRPFPLHSLCNARHIVYKGHAKDVIQIACEGRLITYSAPPLRPLRYSSNDLPGDHLHQLFVSIFNTIEVRSIFDHFRISTTVNHDHIQLHQTNNQFLKCASLILISVQGSIFSVLSLYPFPRSDICFLS